MTTTEEICARLDELGVEYDTYDLPNGEHGVSWIDGSDIEWEAVQQGENFRIHALQLVTTKQAIAATVGTEPDEATMLKLHDRMNAALLDYESAMGIDGGNVANTVPFVIEMHQIIEDAAKAGVGTCQIEERHGDWYCTGCGEMVGTCDPASELFIDGNAIELWRHCPNCGARIEKGKDDGMGQE